MGESEKIKVCHLASGDLWAGAEAQLVTLTSFLVRMNDLDISAILFNEGRLAYELKNLGIKTDVIPESRHNAFSMLRLLGAYFRGQKVDIVHVHKYKENILGGIASACHGIRFRIRTIHGLPEPALGLRARKREIYELLDNFINKWLVDRLLAVSLDLRRELIERFGDEKVRCIHNGIDVGTIRRNVSATDWKKELNIGGNEIVIGTMCRLTPIKGLEFFLKAARIVRSQRSNTKFIIVGDGPLGSSLRTLAFEYGLSRDVFFLGHQDDAYGILQLMDIFVLPSLKEGIPMALLEALALARPVVATRVGGIPEVIEHDISGLLVTPGRGDELAESCIRLIDDYKLAQRLGATGRKTVEEKFSATFMAEKVANVYRELVFNGKEL